MMSIPFGQILYDLPATKHPLIGCAVIRNRNRGRRSEDLLCVGERSRVHRVASLLLVGQGHVKAIEAKEGNACFEGIDRLELVSSSSEKFAKHLPSVWLCQLSRSAPDSSDCLGVYGPSLINLTSMVPM